MNHQGPVSWNPIMNLEERIQQAVIDNEKTTQKREFGD